MPTRASTFGHVPIADAFTEERGSQVGSRAWASARAWRQFAYPVRDIVRRNVSLAAITWVDNTRRAMGLALLGHTVTIQKVN